MKWHSVVKDDCETPRRWVRKSEYSSSNPSDAGRREGEAHAGSVIPMNAKAFTHA